MSNKKIAVTILAFIIVIVYSPLMSLWALKTIFQLNIVYNFWSWFAMSWVHLIIFLTRSTPNITNVQTIPISSDLTQSTSSNSQK